MGSEHKSLVFDDVSKHNKMDDCWIIISGKVYNVTPFMEDHPGGGEVMRKATGKDATIDYTDVGHSDKAGEMMKKYYVGDIDQSTIPVKRSFFQSATHKLYNSEKTRQYIVKMFQVLVSFMILGLAFTVKAYTKEKST
uniref:cytochrome b5-like n=1 Tax=Erigeron canadensis TaxID=72917 RepID=UPI001CB8D915|nr:cytochrome b5-like [Erigeron canadensis]